MSSRQKSTLLPVSVIICSKNEAQNLQKNIPKILAQEYPEFEIILINDASSDDTEDIIERFALENDKVVQVNVAANETFWGNKKYALTLGIKRAKYKQLLFTDADCYPNSPKWIAEMASNFTNDKQLILGYGAYEKAKGSFLNKLIRYETVMTAIQYFSYSLSGSSYMGVGRNLAYSSELFYEQKGFVQHMKVRSGDDDLFVNQSATKANTVIQCSPDSFTVSEPKKTFSSWMTQKRRHVSTARYYKLGHQIALGLFYTSQLLFLLLAIVLMLSPEWRLYTGAAIVLRYLMAWISVGKGSSKLEEKDLVYLFPVLEVVLICVQLTIFNTNLISKPARWK